MELEGRHLALILEIGFSLLGITPFLMRDSAVHLAWYTGYESLENVQQKFISEPLLL
jgi:hypothetical protein